MIDDFINKITFGDCLHIMGQLPDKSVDLIVTDPPYNISKADWDKWADVESYVKWCSLWIKECERLLKDNGSFYFFHNDFIQIIKLCSMIEDETGFIFKNMITWNKKFRGSKNEGFLQGYNEIENLRNYQKFCEYLLFYTFQDETGLSKIQGDCCYPVREYIRNEIIRAKGKIVLKEINEVLGTATNGGGVASAVLSLDKQVPAMITKEHYELLQRWLNNSKEYEYLRKEYEDLRYTFNNQKRSHCVWEFEIAQKELDGHITPKPVSIIENILLYSSNPNALVLDCFSGSGTTAIACHNTNRRFICIEKDKNYFDMSVKRLDDHRKQLSLFGGV